MRPREPRATTDRSGALPDLSVLETALYCPDLGAAEAFYTEVLGLRRISRQPGRHVFFRCGKGVLLLFDPDATDSAPLTIGDGMVPRHGARGPGHVAFRVAPSDLDQWRARLESWGVAIESNVHWPGGGESLYFRDPAGNSLELATGAVWGLSDTITQGEGVHSHGQG